MELYSKGSNFRPKHKRTLTLYNYLDHYKAEYTKKDIRVINAVINKIKDFINDDDFLIVNLTENHFIKFNDYLNYNCGFKGETPNTYYKRFKKIMLQANRDKYIDADIYKDVKFKSISDDSTTTLKKDVLNENEIKILFDTECKNKEIKKAFLFACYSGLGYSEILILKWSNIVNNRLKINRTKSGTEINIQLSKKALELIGEKQDTNSYVFNLTTYKQKRITHNGINKALRIWVKDAKINKHITFYCGRHTFATRLLINKANLKTVADCLGHKTTKNTIKYLNFVNSLKDDATKNLE